MFEILIFGVLFFVGARMVLDRDEAPAQPPAPGPGLDPGPSPGPGPGPSPVPQVTPSLPTVPPGWPSSAPSYDQCEALMSKLPKEQVKQLMTGAMTQTDAQWAVSMKTMAAMGQGELAHCIDGARSVMKSIKM